MNRDALIRHELSNAAQTLLLIGGMSMVRAYCARLLFGDGVALWVPALTADQVPSTDTERFQDVFLVHRPVVTESPRHRRLGVWY